MSWTKFDLLAYESRNAPKHRRGEPLVGCEDESELHEQIINYCNSQWPKWKVIRARMDKKSTLAKGVHDMTIFHPKGVLCIECKTRVSKPSDDQRDWIFEMKRIGHTVHIVRDFDSFLSIVIPLIQPQNEQ